MSDKLFNKDWEENKPADMDELIKSYEDSLPKKGYIVEIYKNWAEIIDNKNVSDHSNPMCIERKTLKINVENSIIGSIISTKKSKIISNINSFFEKVVVTNIKVIS